MSSAALAYPVKSAEAFRTISEVAADLDVPQHVLRFWESRFAQIVSPERIVFDHLSGHHFEMTLRLEPVGTQQTRPHWQQRFDTEEECSRIAEFVAVANEQNLDRLAEVLAATP